MKLALGIVLAALALSACSTENSIPEELLMSIPVTGGELNAIRGGDLCDVESTSGPVVLFLHGASFNANTWVETGTHKLLCEVGLPSLSIDLPGFGKSPRFEHDPTQLLDEVVAFIADDVVLVSPSMSGSYSLPWLATNPGSAAGFVPIAPVGIGGWSTPDGFAVPTRGIWGSTDSVVPVADGRRLISSIDGADLIVIEGGGHAVYMTNPGDFHAAFIDFVQGLSR